MSELLPLDRSVRSTLDTATVGAVLAQLLEGVNVTPVAAGADQIVFAPVSPAAHADVTTSLPPIELTRVVVTGTPEGSTTRPLSVSLSVIDHDALMRASSTSLAGTLDAGMPGIWAWEPSPASGIARFGSIRGASSLGATYPKVYIDGIGVANPLLATTIDPDNVERIEVIRGPQGAALYGSDAISGVINIVTRHENPAGPVARLRVRSTAGVSNSAFAPPGFTQSHSLSVVGGTALRSGQLGVGLSSIGEFYDNDGNQQITASGGFREIRSRATITGVARLSTSIAGLPEAAGASAGTTVNDGTTRPTRVTESPLNGPEQLHLSEYTVGVTARTTTGSRWTHQLVAGVDGYRLRNFADEFTPFPSSTDSALRAARGGADRTTLRASSVAHIGDAARTSATVSLVLEQSTLRQESPIIQLQPRGLRAEGLPLPPPTSVAWLHDAGAITQVDLAVRNHFFVSTGLRLERNDGYLGTARYAALPMIGASYVHDVGRATLKWRAAFGEGIRAPRTAVRETMMGRTAAEAANTLGAERQSGIEGGFDVFVGRSFSLQTTVFNQVASGLIQQVVVPDSSVALLGRDATRLWLSYQNVGAISNRGVEIQAKGKRGPFTVTASYSAVSSRVRTVGLHYTGDLLPGDRVLGVPSQTIGTQVAYTSPRWTALVGVARAMDWIDYDRLSLGAAYRFFDRSEVPLYGADLRGYWRHYNGNTHVRASVSRQIGRNVTGLLTVENLLGAQRGEPDNATVVPGRTIIAGFRVSLF
ncbi:MAG TPA: TonB-dependent receptor plug domain-containing protein [Gemmatimonadaceae bacterium]|nr:TonB-dependent receptor plug domain-containing protein [Gemmatimonadaceae bacterium]